MPIEGVLIADTGGKIAFSTGIGSDPRVRSLAADKAWIKEARERRLQSLTIDRRSLAVLVVPLADGDLLVFSRPPSNVVLDFIGSVDFAYDILEHLLISPFDAMTVVDAKARVVYMSPVHEGFFGLGHGEANGRNVREVIENTRLDKVVASGKSEVGEILKMRGAERVVTRVAIKRDDEIVGAVGRIMFKDPKQVETLSRRINALENEVEFYKREVAAMRSRSYGLESLIGDSPAMRRLRDEIVKVAPLEIPVLINGESGTGKELVAHALHRLSPRRDAAIVLVNAASLPATLVEAELLGYEPGAFTGADRKGRKGRFEQAEGGTIVFDEIGDMPMELQAKLLRVLQDRVVERIGGGKSHELDFRLVTATNHNLQALIAEQKFRLDLYYRISPIVIEVPALRDRIEDIPLLVAQFLNDVADRHGMPRPEVTDSALSYLMEQPWPGNVRQLRHMVERAFVFAENSLISAETFMRHGDMRIPTAGAMIGELPRSATLPEAKTLRVTVGRLEADLVREALVRYKGNKKRVAQELGISRSYLYKLLGETATRDAN
jgi:transcriptional regulator with PAS, ATPase and Fis domain